MLLLATINDINHAAYVEVSVLTFEATQPMRYIHAYIHTIQSYLITLHSLPASIRHFEPCINVSKCSLCVVLFSFPFNLSRIGLQCNRLRFPFATAKEFNITAPQTTFTSISTGSQQGISETPAADTGSEYVRTEYDGNTGNPESVTVCAGVPWWRKKK
jgi:hypothetical protein